MKTKNLGLILTSSAVLFFSGWQAVKAAGPAGSAMASVKGTVKLEGTAPKPKLISMAADPSCAKQHPGPVWSQEVMTDSRGDLQNVIVFVSDGLGDRTFDLPSQPAVIEQKGC